MNKFNFKSVGPVYLFWYSIFSSIEKLFPFSWIRKLKWIKSIKDLPDYWVITNFVTSLVSIFIIELNMFNWVKIVLITYAAIRIAEIVIYQINVLLFHPYTAYKNKIATYRISNPYRSVILLFHNLAEVVFWFVMINRYYGFGEGNFTNDIVTNTLRLFTFNYEQVVVNHWFQTVVFIEVLCGMILIIISLAKFVGKLPHTHIEFEYDDDELI